MNFLARATQKITGAGSHDVFRNMAMLAMGVGSAKLIGLAVIPILTRLYSPSDFGVLSIFTSLVAILAPLMTLRYVVALPLPRSDVLAINLFCLCLLLTSISAVFLAVMLWAFGEVVFTALSMQALVPYWWLVLVGVLSVSSFEIMTLWATRRKVFKPLATSHVWQMTLGSGLKILLGVLAIKPLGLLIGQVVQEAGGVVPLGRHFYRDLCRHWHRTSRPKLKFLFKYYSNLPQYRLPSQFLLVFSTKAPLLFSAFLFGQETTGQLGLALMALALPLNLLGQTTAKAFFSEISNIGKSNPRKIYEVTLSVTKRLAAIAILPTLVLMTLGPWMFSIVFGEEWRLAGQFSSILAIYLFFQLITSPLVNVFTVFNLQRRFLIINAVRTFLVLLAFALAYYLVLTATQSILIYALLLAMQYMIVSCQIFWMLRKASRQESQ